MLKTSRAVSEICSRRDKQRHTDTLIAILRHSYDAGGKTNKVAKLRLGAAASCISHVTRIVIAQREREVSGVIGGHIASTRSRRVR